jgi:hypothetical protein
MRKNYDSSNIFFAAPLETFIYYTFPKKHLICLTELFVISFAIHKPLITNLFNH